MMPEILRQLATSNPLMRRAKQMLGMVNASQNPQSTLNQLRMNNPQMKQVMDVVNQYGGDPQKAFYAIAEQQGVNPQEILNMLK